MRYRPSRVTKSILDMRIQAYENKGFAKTKWIEFCELMLAKGFILHMYEAKSTVSKYITVSHPSKPGKRFRVRFSNHKPIKHRELNGDCDFFVGITNLATTNTEQAIEATLKHFSVGVNA